MRGEKGDERLAVVPDLVVFDEAEGDAVEVGYFGVEVSVYGGEAFCAV